MGWVYIFLTVLFSVIGSFLTKVSHHFTSLSPQWIIYFSYVPALAFFSLSLKKLDVGIAYAIWSGAGTALITLIGWILLKESVTVTKVMSIIMIIGGILGLTLGKPN